MREVVCAENGDTELVMAGLEAAVGRVLAAGERLRSEAPP
jgi:hypothetical protein